MASTVAPAVMLGGTAAWLAVVATVWPVVMVAREAARGVSAWAAVVATARTAVTVAREARADCCAVWAVRVAVVATH